MNENESSRTIPKSSPPRAGDLGELSWRIDARNRYSLGEAIEIGFALENHGETALDVLIWATPFEGWFGNFLKVELDAVPVPYRGPLVKRGEPSAEDYLRLPAGGELTNRLDLSLAYRLDRPGEVSLELDRSLADVVPVSAPSSAPAVPRRRDSHRRHPVNLAAARFCLKEG